MNTLFDEYKIKQQEHFNRMENSRLPKTTYHYRPKGQRSIGTLRNMWEYTA